MLEAAAASPSSPPGTTSCGRTSSQQIIAVGSWAWIGPGCRGSWSSTWGGALDTLSNFTRFVEYLELRERTQDYLGQERRDHTAVVVITSAYHRRRAAAVAAVVLGSRGISFVMEDAAPMHNGRTEKEHQKHLQALRGAAVHEAWWKRSRDAVRAVLWILCGFTGERIVSIRHPGRIGARRRASGTESRFAALVH